MDTIAADVSGALLRDRGMGLAADAQDAAGGFAHLALRAIRATARRQSTVHANDLYGKLPQPKHPNCWGSIWTTAVKKGWIKKGPHTEPCIDPKKHRHNSPVYFSLIHEDA